jgi:hypothetical protein
MAQHNPLVHYTKKIVADATEHDDRRDGPKNEYGHGFLLLNDKNGGERVVFLEFGEEAHSSNENGLSAPGRRGRHSNRFRSQGMKQEAIN